MPLPEEAMAEAPKPTLDEIDAQEEAAKQQARADAIAAHGAHPHTQLRAILKDMQAPGNLDVNARIGVLHQSLSRLVQVVLAHTPNDVPPHPDDASVENHNGQVL